MKILVADDDRTNCIVLQKFLEKWGYDVVTATDGAAAWTLLTQPEPPRLAILDWMMPQMDGAELCKRVRARQDRFYTYIMLLTGRRQKEDVVQGLDAGADDYIVKPFEANELRARLRAGLRILELEDQLVSARDLLQIKANRDSLTDLWNHAAILECVQKELSVLQRNGGIFGLIMADIDHFKQINDNCGHLAGDVALREAAQRMRTSARSYDSIGRYGGEEFLIVIPGADLRATASQAERLRRLIQDTPVHTPEGAIGMTISLGVVATAASDHATVESLLRAADGALYRAKQLGRNRVELCEISQEGLRTCTGVV